MALLWHLFTLVILALAVAGAPVLPHLGDGAVSLHSPSSSSSSGSIWYSLDAVAESVARSSAKAPRLSPTPTPSSSSSSGSRFFQPHAIESDMTQQARPAAAPHSDAVGSSMSLAPPQAEPRRSNHGRLAQERQRRAIVDDYARKAGWLSSRQRATLMKAPGSSSSPNSVPAPLVHPDGRPLSKLEYARLGGYVNTGRETRPRFEGQEALYLKDRQERERAGNPVVKHGELLRAVERGRVNFDINDAELNARLPWESLTVAAKYSRIAAARRVSQGKPKVLVTDPELKKQRARNATAFLSAHGIDKKASPFQLFPHPESSSRQVSVYDQAAHQIKVKQALWDVNKGPRGLRPHNFADLRAQARQKLLRNTERMLEEHRRKQGVGAAQHARGREPQPQERGRRQGQ